jgi:hypothetical protein
VVEEVRSLSFEEQSLHEFLLDQIIFLQESLESCLVPCVAEELLGRELVIAPPLDEDIQSPSTVKGKVEEGRSVAICAPGPCQWEPR